MREVDPSVMLQKNNLLFRVLSSQLGGMVNKSLVVVNVALAHSVVVEEKVVLVGEHFEDVFHRRATRFRELIVEQELFVFRSKVDRILHRYVL